MDYTPKQLYFQNEGREKLISGIEKLSKAVKVTMGAKGNTVLIESPHHTRGITVTKDGATVAKSIDLLDPIENLACRILKNASEATALDAGDGTTSSIVLAEAIIKEGILAMESHNLNRSDLFFYMNQVCDKIIEILKSNSIPLNDELLESVAIISANNDIKIGGIVAEAYRKVGKNGYVRYENSMVDETYIDIIDGMKIDRGYSQRHFVNDHERDECILNKGKVLVCDIELTNFVNQISPLLIEDLVKKQIPLLIIAPCSKNFTSAIVANTLKGTVKWCIIDPPSMGYRRDELMTDIALLTGATYFNEKSGESLLTMRMDDLGDFSKAVVGEKETVLVSSEDYNKEAVDDRVDQLLSAHDKSNKKGEKDFIMQRIASLSGKIGIIYVGGMDLEQKELMDRVEDSVMAVRAAIVEGVVAGGGKALIDVMKALPPYDENANMEQVAAQSILMSSILYPAKQILLNAGLDYSKVYSHESDNQIWDINRGYNVKTKEYGDMIKMGVVDPFKVTRTALKNALSVAITILSTDAIVTMAREIDKG